MGADRKVRAQIVAAELGRTVDSNLVTGWFPAHFAFPSSDDESGEAIPQDVYTGARHVHELIDTEEEKDRFERQMKRGCGGQHDYERGARYPRCTLAADQECE